LLRRRDKMKPANQPGAGCAAGPAGERRREIRYPSDAAGIVRRASGQTVRPRAVEIELGDEPGRPFWNWGLGGVAYSGDGCAGIQLLGGRLDRPDAGL